MSETEGMRPVYALISQSVYTAFSERIKDFPMSSFRAFIESAMIRSIYQNDEELMKIFDNRTDWLEETKKEREGELAAKR